MSFITEGYFPLPVPTVLISDVGPDTNYPVPLTLAQAAKWMWRVRDWEFAFDFDFSSPPTGDFNLAGVATFDKIGPTTEKEIIYGEGYTSDTILFDQPAGAENATGGFGMSLWVADTFETQLVKVGTDYYPVLNFRGNFTIPGTLASFTLSSVQSVEHPTPTGTPAVIDTVEVPLFYNIIDPDASGLAYLAGTITATPVNYWPWGGTTDPSTGTLLIPGNILPQNYVEIP